MIWTFVQTEIWFLSEPVYGIETLMPTLDFPSTPKDLCLILTFREPYTYHLLNLLYWSCEWDRDYYSIHPMTRNKTSNSITLVPFLGMGPEIEFAQSH